MIFHIFLGILFCLAVVAGGWLLLMIIPTVGMDIYERSKHPVIYTILYALFAIFILAVILWFITNPSTFKGLCNLMSWFFTFPA